MNFMKINFHDNTEEFYESVRAIEDFKILLVYNFLSKNLMTSLNINYNSYYLSNPNSEIESDEEIQDDSDEDI